MHEHLVLIGAGSASFTRGLVADVVRAGGSGALSLVDPDPAALAVAEGLARKLIAAGGADLELRAAVDRRAVLADATAVVCTVGVGGRRAWEQDVFVPRRHGIWQPVGDTVMPGGTSRALRMIPAMVAIARDVVELAPAALFFNYSNPMSPVCRAIRRAVGAEVVGLCHGVFHVASELAALLGVPAESLSTTAAGINHLTWFTELRAGGVDLGPKLAELARAKVAQITAGQSVDDPFTWQLCDLTGAFPAVKDRHITEFFGRLFAAEGSYFGRTLGVEAFSFEQTIAWGDQGFERMAAVARGEQPLPPEWLGHGGGEHEQVVDIIASIRGDAGRTYSANLPNRGQVPNLPAEAVIESPALALAPGLRPIQLPPLPPFIAGTLASRFEWVETVVEAALRGSRRHFVQALLLDGAVSGLDQAERLADELLAAQRDYLPQFA
jgi:alpha-galactosidase